MPPRRPRSKLQFWWFTCIGTAFVLLALRSLVRGDPTWSIALRAFLAAGFFFLARSAS